MTETKKERRKFTAAQRMENLVEPARKKLELLQQKALVASKAHEAASAAVIEQREAVAAMERAVAALKGEQAP